MAQAVREEIVNRIEETASDKEAEPPEISRAEVKNVLEACGISEESVKAFEEKYNEEFGLGGAERAEFGGRQAFEAHAGRGGSRKS